MKIIMIKSQLVLVHCQIVNNDYQSDPRVLYTFVPNSLFGISLHTSPKNFLFLKTFNSESPYLEGWITEQNSKPLEIEVKRKTTLVVN